MIVLAIQMQQDGGASVRALAETTVASFLSFNPGWWAEVMPICETGLPSGQKLVAGEGAQGGDGFVACCDADGKMVFVAFLDCSNPFVHVAMSPDGTKAEATNNRGIVWEFDLVEPWKIRTRTSAM